MMTAQVLMRAHLWGSSEISVGLTQPEERVQEALRDSAGKFSAFCQNYMRKFAIPLPAWVGREISAVRSEMAAFAKGRLLILEDLNGSYRSEGCWAEALPQEIAHFAVSERAAHEILENLAENTRFCDPNVDKETSLGREDLFLSFIKSENFLRAMNIDRTPSIAYLRDDDAPEAAGLTLCRHAATGDDLLTRIVLKQLPSSLNLGYLRLAKECAQKGGHDSVVSLIDSDLRSCCSSTRSSRMWLHLKSGPFCRNLLALGLAVSLAANMVFIK